MGAACLKPMNSDDEGNDRVFTEGNGQGIISSSILDRGISSSEDIVISDRAATKRLRKDSSLFRVGSFIKSSTRKFSASGSSLGNAPNGGNANQNKRATNYDHVHDAVMHNFEEAGALVSVDSGTPPAGVVGLRNLGNTCFINSSLQCLSNTIPLTDYFLGYDYRKEINKDNFLGTGGKLATAYAELMKDMWLKNKRGVVTPASFKKSLSTFAPQFGGSRQHDAQELLAYLLDGIHEDLNRVKKRPYIEDKDCGGKHDEMDAKEAWANYLRRNKSLVVDLFQGQFRNTCVCQQCGHQNIRFEPSMYLSLPITDSCRSLEDCLNLYLEEENLTGDNQWYCEKCKEHTDATKKTDLWVLPPILIIHLKRFKCDAYGRAGRKNNAALQYPITGWDLSKLIRSRGGGTPLYDLYAVSNHLGSLGGGHYTAYALNRFDEKWYEFNDSTHRVIDPETTFGTSSSPYLLFYNRAASTEDAMSHPAKRGLLIRRQSVSQPELWPHSQVREGQFREFQRSTTMQSSSWDVMDPLPEEVKNRKPAAKASSNGATTNGSRNSSEQKKKPTGKKKHKKKDPQSMRRNERLKEKVLLT